MNLKPTVCIMFVTGWIVRVLHKDFPFTNIVQSSAKQQHDKQQPFGTFLSVLIIVGFSILSFAASANASNLITLKYDGTQVTVPFSEIDEFTLENQSTDALDEFFQHVPIASDSVQHLLSLETAVNPERFSSTTIDFVLLQLDKFLGDINGRENSDAMRTAFTSAYKDDQTLSILELIEDYPDSRIRVDLRRMDATYNDIKSFVERIQPLLFVADELLTDLVCACSNAPGWLERDTTQSSALPISHRTTDYSQRFEPEKTDCPDSLAPTYLTSPTQPVTLVSSAATPTSSKAADFRPSVKQLVFAYGPFRPSFSIDELTTFAETGAVPSSLDFYLRLANLKPKVLRSVLTREVSVEFGFLDSTLNSLLGEYALFQIGQIIHTRTRKANIQALRAGLVLSARTDNRFSLIEFLQNYPLQQVYVDGAKLASIARDVGRVAGGITKGDTRKLEDFLVDVRASIAQDVCTCDTPQT
jgi:hypothetical protein